MATTAVNLSVPAPAEDTMEMSSPARHDGDDDMGFIDFGDAEQANDQDQMMDDDEQTRPTTATDDVMEDDLQQGEDAVVQEHEMQDSPAHDQPFEDEELIDYSDDDEVQDEVVEDADVSPVNEQPADAGPIISQDDVDEEIVRQPDEPTLTPPAEETVQVTAVGEETVHRMPQTEETGIEQASTTAVDSQAEEAALAEQALAEPHDDSVAQPLEDTTAEPSAAEDEDVQRPVMSVDTSVPTVEGPTTPTDTGLHATTVRFGDSHFPLFKSRKQPDGLLKDDNLASLSLGELMQNCRQRLAIKTGETLSDDQDLVLGFDQLGLILVEDSRAAFDCSLEEILDVYLQLHRNDEVEDIPPFSLILSLQRKFTSSVSVLKQAAAGGSGMSSFDVHHADDEEHAGDFDGYAQDDEDEGDETYDAQYPEDEGADDQDYEQGAAEEGHVTEQQQANTNDHHGGYEDQQNEYEEHADYYEGAEDQYYEQDLDQADQENHYQEFAEEQSRDDDAEGAGVAAENEGDYHETSDLVNDATQDASLLSESVQPSREEANGEQKTASTATSITLQGDEGLDTNDHVAGDNVNDSTLLTKDEGDADGQTHAASELEYTQITEQTQAQDSGDVARPADGAENPESEDYLGDINHYLYDGEGGDQGHAYAADGDENAGKGQEYDQTDETGVQLDNVESEELHHEDDDRFQTAHELQDGKEAADSAEKQATMPHDGPQAPETEAANGTATQAVPDDDFIIDFDEELPSDFKSQKDVPAGARTPPSKRSFEEFTDDEIDYRTPEPKKAKAL